MKFITYIPQAVLQPYISSFIVSESADARTYRVLPGTGPVIGFQYRGRLAQVTGVGSSLLDVSGITGLYNTARTFTNTAGTGSVLVYFKEAGASAFFKQPLHELFNESVSLDNFMLRSELLIVEEQLQEAQTDEERIKVVESFLLARLQPVAADELVAAAVALIHKSKGDIRIKDLALQLHTSQSPLEKRFRSRVGASPKKFASIIRMKHAIQQYTPGASLTGLGYEAGFYDQSHFIREFKLFTGQSPESFFSGL